MLVVVDERAVQYRVVGTLMQKYIHALMVYIYNCTLYMDGSVTAEATVDFDGRKLQTYMHIEIDRKYIALKKHTSE